MTIDPHQNRPPQLLAICQPANQQLEWTVIRQHVRAASADAPLWARGAHDTAARGRSTARYRPHMTLFSDLSACDLRLVERQLAQRENWRRENEYAFRQVLAKLEPEDAAAKCSNASVHQRARPELLDLRTVIHLRCHAVIGRSVGMSDAEREARRLEDQKRGEWGSPQVITYDRLLSKAKALESRGAA